MAGQQSDTESPHTEDAKQKDERFRQKIEGFVPDLLKRTFYAGLGAIFTSEEGLRRIANEFSLPKDVANYLITQAQGTKSELFRIVAGEVRGFLESLNLSEELQRLLTSLSFEIKTEVRFIPNAQKVKPSIKSSVAVRRRRPEDEQEPVEEEPPAES